MRHSDEEIERASRTFERLADDLDPEVADVQRTDDLQQVAAAAEAVQADEAALREAVHRARSHGRSWNQLAVALGVSRQAARQRFGETARR